MARTAHRTFDQILEDALSDGIDPDEYWALYDQLLEDSAEYRIQTARDIERGL